MDTQEQIKVMQAFADGKEVQMRAKNSSFGWNAIIDKQYNAWDWSRYDYRIKPLPVLREYDNKEEFFEALKLHGPYIKLKDGIEHSFPQRVYDHSISWNSTYGEPIDVHFANLLKDFCWQDGSPCGIIINKQDEKEI